MCRSSTSRAEPTNQQEPCTPACRVSLSPAQLQLSRRCSNPATGQGTCLRSWLVRPFIAVRPARCQQLMQPTVLRRSTRFAEEYILGKCVGSGAFGTVHLAVHRTTGEEVAVKILSKTRAKQSREKTLSKLQREVEVLQQLSPCANVVKLLNKYEDDGFAYLVMEYCSGGDLEQLVEVGARIAWLERALDLCAWAV